MQNYNPLVALGLATGAHDSAVFCFPGAGDSVTSFVSFANELNIGCPIYGMQPRGIIADQEPYSSIDEMADEYCQIILSKGAGVRAFLIGHSFGGYVAMKVAQKLEQNLSIGTLILLDVTAPQDFQSNKSRPESLLELIRMFELGSNRNFNIDLEFLAGLTDEAQLELVQTVISEAASIPKRSIQHSSIKGMVNLFIKNSEMRFCPESPYHGEAILIDAIESDASPSSRSRNYAKWRRVVPKIKYVQTAGNHITMLKRENISALVSMVRRVWAI
ncbi:alpha/beta fold hydrolase [Marinobacter sp. NFXS9]|uniref:thioesterase domain-containing protein n=1 Tax=Marinobacter sp. NFXS9 TaxID=2818433 RepID=UPI0032E035D7